MRESIREREQLDVGKSCRGIGRSSAKHHMLNMHFFARADCDVRCFARLLQIARQLFPTSSRSHSRTALSHPYEPSLLRPRALLTCAPSSPTSRTRRIDPDLNLKLRLFSLFHFPRLKAEALIRHLSLSLSQVQAKFHIAFIKKLT